MTKYHVGSLLAKTICGFGYNETEIDNFFNGVKNEKISYIYEDIVRMVNQAKNENTKVFIYGDYDCDGICSTSILVSLLNSLNIENGYYIPNRFSEGYGLNLLRLKQAYEKGYKYLICVDNGVSSFDEINWAKEHDMKIIIIDHHEITDNVNADILLHPNLLPANYHHLCATGLVYYLAKYLDLLDSNIKIIGMIGTIADMMELKGVNIPIVLEGIETINQEGSSKIFALYQDMKLPITEDDIAYYICPKINAVGRLADIANPNHLVKFFISRDINEIVSYGNAINEINNKRKQMSVKQYELIKENADFTKPFIIYYSNDIHEGLCGLLAGRLANEYNKPTIIFSLSNGVLKGSGRGIGDFDIFSALLPFKDKLLTFGGHKQACGLSLSIDLYDSFIKYIGNISVDDEQINYYLPVSLEDLSNENIIELFRYRPYGQARKLPLYGLKNENFINYRKLKNDNQLKWLFKNGIECISWQNNKGYSYYLSNNNLLLLGRLKENNFVNKTNYNLICEQIIEL